MHIHNFYLFAVCALWLYLLLWLSGRLWMECLLRRIRAVRQTRIRRVFSLQESPRSRRRITRQLPRYARDSQLFALICDCYAALPPDCPVHIRYSLSQAVLGIFCRKIDRISEAGPLERALLLEGIRQCRIFTWKTQRYLELCASDCALAPFLHRPDPAREKAVR